MWKKLRCNVLLLSPTRAEEEDNHPSYITRKVLLAHGTRRLSLPELCVRVQTQEAERSAGTRSNDGQPQRIPGAVRPPRNAHASPPR